MSQNPQNDTNQTHKVTTDNLKYLFSRAIDPSSFVNTIINEAVSLGTSDILFEPGKNQLKIRARIDSVLYELGHTDLEIYANISSRIKVLSNLDPTEKRRIQEGQFTIEHQGHTVNLRVEIAQTVCGEMIVIRIHESQTIIMPLTKLGLGDIDYQNYLDMIQQGTGLILVCGPTGCGKTTTLYSTINKLNQTQNYNIMTIEDPVEYRIEGVNQMQTHEKTGFNFTSGLRTILRLSPDVVLVGEIRDQETAKIAIESGLTGQLVLSTVHADDTVGTLLRLLDLGIETYLLNSALLGVVAQRLVRKICPKCKEAYQPNANEVDLFQKQLGHTPKQLFRGKGCPECKNLSFQGREGIFEVLKINSQVRTLIRKKTNEEELRHSLLDKGFISLIRSGLAKCEAGITTVDEVLRNSLRIE